MTDEQVSQGAQALIEMMPGYQADRAKQLVWWGIVWYFITDHVDEFPAEIMPLARQAARNKPRWIPGDRTGEFPAAAAKLLQFRRDMGAVGWYRDDHREYPGKHQPCVDADALLKQWHKYMKTGHQRKGQALFNALYDLNPQLADELRASPIDCFHNDKNRVAFYGRATGWISTDYAIRNCHSICYDRER